MNSSRIEQLFSLASAREMEAQEFYSSAARKMKDTCVRETFEQLAREEMKHFELIENFRSDSTLIMKISAPSADWKVAEGEALPVLTTDMKPKDAIALAMKKEQQAVELYRALSHAATDAGTKSIFDNLANMELGHKNRLEKIFVDIGYPEVF